MPNANRTRAILAAQKVRRVDDPEAIAQSLKLTPEQRRAKYAPKPATSAPRHIQGPQWVEAWRMMTRITYGLTAIFSLFFGGVMAGESKKGFKG
ncbi:hypothetical protein UFOVP419_28 [uncultured Caudovirales phage]|uniref:Uncharacterized protein n=1 Tax=uncultured Caudovirales phage TaxID=2100421 RepID=A0A6J5M4Z1_9CAUD|nr:hypothetical protein UFOVP419_28 [uncultured Caudovirales phage]